MKLFAPKNNWDMTSPSSWWPLMGSIQTSSGVMITEESALGLTAFACGVRVISETLASLPCNLLEQVDNRTTKKATSHSLYSIVHDQPNSEQDSMIFFDSQVALQVGWGNCYAEIQRTVSGAVYALLPIHPSRIPLGNIRRNSNNPEEIYAGEPGELVYYVNNDDGTATPIPARDMLHVAGVLSKNGITGRSLVNLGRNALGIAQATEDHAGSFFKNGANPNMAIKSPKIVGKEAAERLRNQWQTVFGGVKNHYKTILLEEGMEAVPLTMSPEVSQLIVSRQYGVTEVARLLRIPPHMLMDLTRATFSNIEAQGQELITYSLMPWIVRWEKAMYRQLLTPEEKKKYRFKFNVMGLLRGDQAARGEFYSKLFQMGAFSPNQILELEDMNPVEGGDQRFVPANNLVPLDKIGDMAQANIDKVKGDTITAVEPVNPDASSSDAAPVVVDGTQDVQATALNGAQIAAMVQITTLLATDQLPPEATRAMLKAAFPSMDDSLIKTIVEDLARFEPDIPEPDPVPAPPPEPAKTDQPSQPPDTQTDTATQVTSLVKKALRAIKRQEKAISSLSDGVSEKVAAIECEIKRSAEAQSDAHQIALSQIVESVDAKISAAVEEQRGERAQSQELVQEMVARSGETVGGIASAMKEYVETLPGAMETAFQPLTAAFNEQKEASENGTREVLAAIEANAVAIVPAPPPVDTSAIEAIAVREAAVAQRERELAEQLASERQASHGVLNAAIRVRLENLADWESKSLAKAVDRPKEFKTWREKFYPRFSKQFAAVLSEMAPYAAQVGVVLEPDAIAERYSVASITDLKTLDEFADDNWHDRLREGTDMLRKNLWTERVAALATEVIEQGKLQFEEQSHA